MVGVTRLELIACHRKRESKFQSRLKGMKKKAYELSTLCGLDIGMIICSPSGKIETLSWPDQHQDGNILLDLIAKYKNQDGKPNKTRISKKKKVACQSELDVDVRSEKELRESVMCLDSKIQTVEERIQHLKKEKQAADESEIIDGDGDDLVSWLNDVMDQPDSPINEDSTTTWPQELPSLVQPNAEAFASYSDKSGHSNIPSLMTTGGYPISSQVMIGRAAFQEFNYNTNYNGDQLSYNPYPWRTPY